MEVRQLDISEYNDWDRFVQSTPQATIYCKSWYLEAVKMPFTIKAVVESGQIVGGIILIKNRIKLYGNPLLCKYLGVLVSDFEGNEYNRETKRRKVSKLLIDEIQAYRSFNYSFHPSFINFLPFYWTGYSSTTNYTYVIFLAGRSEADLSNDLHGKLRSELKYAASQNYRIVEDLDFETFYEVNSKTYLRQGGSPPFKADYLRSYYDSLSKKNAITLKGIANGDEIMAVVGLIYDEHVTSLIFNGFDPDKMQRGANEMLVWHAILFGMQHSRSFDFEGSMMNAIDSFYRKFGGIHTPFLRIYKDNFFNYTTQKARKLYKQIKYGR